MAIWDIDRDSAAYEYLKQVYAAMDKPGLGTPVASEQPISMPAPTPAVSTSIVAPPSIGASAPAAASAAPASEDFYVVGGVKHSGKAPTAGSLGYGMGLSPTFSPYETAEEKRRRLGI